MRVISPRILALCLILGGSAFGAPLIIEGEIPADAGTFITVTFPVDARQSEVEVRHESTSKANVLDWGLLDPSGKFWGWSGSNPEPALVGTRAASRGYQVGTLPPGRWSVLIGLADVREFPAKYRLEVETRTKATLTNQSRSPYTPAPALNQNARWYAGDLHVHSIESGDGHSTITEIAAFAASRSLDFVAISDHNTTSQLDFISPAQARQPSVLLVPSVEFTSSLGHFNAFGASSFVPFWLGRDDVTFQRVLQQYAAQRAVVTINHPTLDVGSRCLGCSWQLPISPSLVGAIEIGIGGWDQTGSLFDESAIALWESLADRGIHLTAVGGSDDHAAGQTHDQTQSPLGSPTTLLYASELSVPALSRAIREGRSVVKLRGPTDPLVTLTSLTPLSRSGDTLVGRSAQFQARTTGAQGLRLAWIENGAQAREVEVTSDPFTDEWQLEAPDGRSARIRAELRVGELPRTLTSHLWLAPDSPPGPPMVVPRAAPRGCVGCATTFGWPLWAIAAWLRRRRS